MDFLSEEFWFRYFTIGQVTCSPASILLGVILVILLFVLKAWVKRVLVGRIFPRFKINRGLADAYGTLMGYLLLVAGFWMILPFVFHGFKWTTLSVMLGALSVGIGFGLRNIADNFVSGLIILFERPIKVGDRVTIDGLSGTVSSIRARSTTVRTNDNIDIIVPNSEFIAKQVINWSHRDRRVRFRVPVGVHYNSDVKLVEKALLEGATRSKNVLENPPASVRFSGFGDSALDFELWVWTDTMSDNPKTFISELNFLIWDVFKENGIEIPYPQRDLYVKELPKGMTALLGEAESVSKE